MSGFVVDASIVMAYLVSDAATEQVTRFFRSRSRSDQLLIPEFCLLECTNVLWKHVRLHGMPVETAQSQIELLTTLLPLQRVSMHQILQDALAIALRNNLPVYDSAYIALALQQHFPLITLDEKQTRSAQLEGVSILPIHSF